MDFNHLCYYLLIDMLSLDENPEYESELASLYKEYIEIAKDRITEKGIEINEESRKDAVLIAATAAYIYTDGQVGKMNEMLLRERWLSNEP